MAAKHGGAAGADRRRPPHVRIQHDKEIFEPIDDRLLIPTDRQALLYAYRSICREPFVKESSFRVLEHQLKNETLQKALKDMFQGMYIGTGIGPLSSF
jgi:hypothetical protein